MGNRRFSGGVALAAVLILSLFAFQANAQQPTGCTVVYVYGTSPYGGNWDGSTWLCDPDSGAYCVTYQDLSCSPPDYIICYGSTSPGLQKYPMPKKVYTANPPIQCNEVQYWPEYFSGAGQRDACMCPVRKCAEASADDHIDTWNAGGYVVVDIVPVICIC